MHRRPAGFLDVTPCSVTAFATATSVPGSCVQLELSVRRGLEEEDGPVHCAGGGIFVRNLAAGQLCDFAHDDIVQPVFRSAFRNVSQNSQLTCQPRVRSALNVIRKKVLQKGEGHGRAYRKSDTAPQRYAPCCGPGSDTTDL